VEGLGGGRRMPSKEKRKRQSADVHSEASIVHRPQGRERGKRDSRQQVEDCADAHPSRRLREFVLLDLLCLSQRPRLRVAGVPGMNSDSA
jgi:hypothetical protein